MWGVLILTLCNCLIEIYHHCVSASETFESFWLFFLSCLLLFRVPFTSLYVDHNNVKWHFWLPFQDLNIDHYVLYCYVCAVMMIILNMNFWGESGDAMGSISHQPSTALILYSRLHLPVLGLNGIIENFYSFYVTQNCIYWLIKSHRLHKNQMKREKK